jgi:hypothetical protein
MDKLLVLFMKLFFVRLVTITLEQRLLTLLFEVPERLVDADIFFRFLLVEVLMEFLIMGC